MACRRRDAIAYRRRRWKSRILDLRAAIVTEQRLVIERLGHRGEGVARTDQGLVFVPYALPGETVRAEVQGGDGRLVEILEPSPSRIEPICSYYGVCGGCAVQTLAPHAYAEWKRSLVVAALRNAGLDLKVAPLVGAHGAGRRRVTFHARINDGRARLGFMQARAHELVEIEACPLLASSLCGALPAARAVAQALAARGKPLDVAVTGTMNGLDIDVRGAGALGEGEMRALTGVAERLDLARLSNHARLIALRRPPGVMVGDLLVVPPAGAFLQATEEGERALAQCVQQAARGAKRVADLFCGVGTFALRLAATAHVSAFDGDASAIEALERAARSSGALRPIDAQVRDLFRRPLAAVELSEFDAIVFDPPRAGAEAQARAIAGSQAPRVVAVSCNAMTFARDAKILIDGGYTPGEVMPIDQFLFSPHVEIVALFERKTRPRTKRSLLSG
jgi:23S rRNA (uracil1939-C5)-methyltransferase